VFGICLLCSCSSLRAGIYLSSVNDQAGKTFLREEPAVRAFLRRIADTPEAWTFRVFSRTGVNWQTGQTPLLTHSFYLLDRGDGEWHTLSFNGTKIARRSKGAWAMDTNTDASSYQMYLEGNNRWNLREIFAENTVNAQATAENIIGKIDSGITYYYRDHIQDLPGVENCNTALYETVVLEQ
jgi:hypothetical protein